MHQTGSTVLGNSERNPIPASASRMAAMGRILASASGVAVALALFAGFTAPAVAQYHAYRSNLIRPSEANRYGLRRAWYTHAEVDPARGRLGSITPHVSSTEGHTVFEVQYKGGSLDFSERHLDAFGKPLGIEGARRLADAKLEELKAAQLEPKLVTHVVPKTTLYVVSDRAMIQAIDGENGHSRWMQRVGKRDYPTMAAGANDKYVGVVNGSTLYLLDSTSGNLLWQRSVTNVPGAGPAISDEFAFVPMVNGAMEAYAVIDSGRPPNIFRSYGRAMIQPTVTPSSLAWPTDVGRVYVGRANEPGIRYRLEANRTIVSQVTWQAPNSLFATSIDGFVYCIQEISGAILWRHSLGEPLSQSAIPIGESVYVVTDTQGLYCLDSKTGEEKWWTPRVSGFVAASGERVYATGPTGEILVLNAATGGRIGSIDANVEDLAMANSLTDRVYVGTPSGMIQCLHETQLRFPMLHASAAESANQKPQVVQQGLDDQPKPVDQKPQDPFGGGAKDPFGGGGKDPFGGGGAAPAAGAPANDPFGGGAANPFGGGGAVPDKNPFD